MGDQDGDAIAALAECPNLLCQRVIGIAFHPSEPLCQVFCGFCKAEVEFPNPYWMGDDPTSCEGEQEGER